MAAVGKHEADVNTKPECVISSGYDPIKSEAETDDEDMYKDTNTSNSHENHLPINNIKEEAVKAEVKTEDDVSTDDEQYKPENVVSSSGYDPLKSEETDDEDTSEDTNNNTSNEQTLPIKVKAEVKTEDDVSTDDECGNKVKESVQSLTQSNVSTKKSVTKKTMRYISKRKKRSR